MSDVRNWWQCRNGNGMIGYVPNTILVLTPGSHVAKASLAKTSLLSQPVSIEVPPTAGAQSSENYAQLSSSQLRVNHESLNFMGFPSSNRLIYMSKISFNHSFRHLSKNIRVRVS